MKDTDFLDLMNKGFIVYQEDDGWILKKIATPTDQRVSITCEVCMDTSKVVHSNFKSAFEHAMFLASADKDKPIPWEVFVRFNRGLGPESKRMEDVFAVTKEEAQEKADKVAFEKYENQFIEAIVRPAI